MEMMVVLTASVILGMLVFIGRLLKQRRNLETHVVESPRYCLTCQRPENGHNFWVHQEGDDLHEFVPAYLVYIPDEDVQQYWPSTPPSHLR